jgi:hypothetical protein
MKNVFMLFFKKKEYQGQANLVNDLRSNPY